MHHREDDDRWDDADEYDYAYDIGSELQRYLEDKTRGKFVAKKHGRHALHQLAEDFRDPKMVFSKST